MKIYNEKIKIFIIYFSFFLALIKMSKRQATPLHHSVPKKMKEEPDDIIIILDTPSTASSLKSPLSTASPLTKYSTYAFYNTNVKRKLDFSEC